MPRPGCDKHASRAMISCEACYPDDILQAEIARLQSTAIPSAPSQGTRRPKRTDSESTKKRKSVFDQLDG